MLFAPDSIFNREISADVELAPQSDVLVQHLVRQVAQYPVTLGRNAAGSMPVYIVPGDQQRVPVALNNPTPAWRSLLAQTFAAGVPIPTGAVVEADADRHLVVWCQDTDELWECGGLVLTSSGWVANWGGHKIRVSEDPGFYRNAWYAGARVEAPWHGATACSISCAGGVVMQSEVDAGEVDHALQLLVHEARAGVFSKPAQRTDGADSHPRTLPEGAVLQFDPSKDYSSLPDPLAMLARAGQTYGLVVMDQTTKVGGGTGFSLRFQSAASAGVPDPVGGQGLGKLLPWQDVRVLRMDLATHYDGMRVEISA